MNAFVYGRRLGEPTRAGIPLNGIAVDNYFAERTPALAGTPRSRRSEAAKHRGHLLRVRTGGQPLQQEVAAEVGGQTVFLCRPDHVDLNERVVAAESGPPRSGGPEAST